MFLLLHTPCTQYFFHCEGELLRVRLIMKKNHRILTFSFTKLIYLDNIHKYLDNIQENIFMSNMSYLILIYSDSYLPFVQEFIFIVTHILINNLIFTYIHNWPLQPFSTD